MPAVLNQTVLRNSSPIGLPALAYGTFEAKDDDRARAEDAVLAALKAGYRHLDTASYYDTEVGVGNAIRKSGIPREEIIVTTKFWNEFHDPAGVALSLDQSLKRLGLEYVDLYLMHWPIAFKRTDDNKIAYGSNGKPIIDQELTANHESTWAAMERLVDSGKARSIGVSNFNTAQLTKLLSHARIPPACNQVELHPLLPQEKLKAFCAEKNISLTAYSPLGSQGSSIPASRRLLNNPVIVAAAERLGVEPAQIVIAWGIQRGTGVIPKSATPSRIVSNFDVPTLPDEVMQEISEIVRKDPSKRTRFVNMSESWGLDEIFSEQE